MNPVDRPQHSRRFWALLALIVAAGFALRVAAARGGLWLDEAWSAQFARDTGTLLGVFLRINHDNNHHLNTLWLLLVGDAAPPLVQRGLSIVTGTAAIVVAALILARRGMAAALVAAALFAASPMLVTYGSEARGYAPMLLALLVAILLVDRWLARPDRPLPARALALAALFGMLAQLTFAFGLVALAGWAAVTLFHRHGPARALADTLRLLGPAIGVAAAFALLTFLAARASPTGFQFGDFDAFTFAKFIAALGEATGATLGLPLWLAPFALAPLLFVGAPRAGGFPRLPFYTLAILAFPLAVALLQLPNSGFARYYLLSAVALLLFCAELAGRGLALQGWRRGAIVAIAFAILGGSLIADARLIAHGRGDPGAAIEAIARRAPAGAAIAIEHPRSAPVLEVAARQRGYPTRVSEAACPAARFLYLDRDGDFPFPASPVLCGANYREIAGARPTGLSGVAWRLYERETR